MEVNYSGLKCDHCNYRDDSVPFSDYEKSIGRPCPECGNSLLTMKDYQSCLRIYKMIELMNKIGRILRWLSPFHYWRLLFGDKRDMYSLDIKFLNDKNKPKTKL